MSDEADDRDLHARGARLLNAAFGVVRESGRDDWRSMTAAVLKNRLLDITNRRFDESVWDAGSFLEFLARFEDVVSVDRSTRPPLVHLLADVRDDADPPVPVAGPDIARPGLRIRQDLWRAAMDYSSGSPYVWEDGRAVAEDGSANPAVDRLVLPTIAPDELTAWRREFARTCASAAADSSALDAWSAEGRGTSALPPALRGAWNGFLKQHVHDRLLGWFGEHGLEPPGDLVGEQSSPPDAGQTERLRALVITCVRGMTRGELEALQLPAGALLRLPR